MTHNYSGLTAQQVAENRRNFGVNTISAAPKQSFIDKVQQVTTSRLLKGMAIANVVVLFIFLLCDLFTGCVTCASGIILIIFMLLLLFVFIVVYLGGRWNESKERMEINARAETYGYDKKIFERLGCFEFEYEAQNFMVQGAKRYLCQHDNEIQVTVAGMVKGSLEAYVKKLQIQHVQNEIPLQVMEDFKRKPLKNIQVHLKREILNYISDQEKHNMIWDIFNDDLRIPAGDSMKKTTVYYDKAFNDTLTDYFGNTEVIEEGSCVAIIDIPFTMSMEEEFMTRIASLQAERKRMIHKGVL